MLKLYTDDSEGLRVSVDYPFDILRHALAAILTRRFCSDPFIVLVLSLSFIASIFFLHISAKIIRAFTK
jgi:protein transport protein SEC61 subunit beta